MTFKSKYKIENRIKKEDTANFKIKVLLMLEDLDFWVIYFYNYFSISIYHSYVYNTICIIFNYLYTSIKFCICWYIFGKINQVFFHYFVKGRKKTNQFLKYFPQICKKEITIDIRLLCSSCQWRIPLNWVRVEIFLVLMFYLK